MGVCVEPSESESTRFFRQLCDLEKLKIGSTVLPFQNLPSMPSVGMRLSTRVFVPKSVVKDADGARVLRSGKRLWSETSDGKPGQDSEAEVWFRLLDHSSDADDVLYCKDNGWHNVVAGKEVPLKILDTEMAPESMNNRSRASTTEESVDKLYGTVYHRKRQRLGANQSFSSSLPSEDRMYGIPFVRKQRGKRPSESSSTALSEEMEVVEDDNERQVLPCKLGFLQQDVLNGFFLQAMVFMVTKPTFGSTSRFACVLNSILSYMMRNRVKLSELTAFVSAKPIAQAFSLNGIHLLHDHPCSIIRKNDILVSGICKIFEASGDIPLFSLDFLSVPHAFMYLHSSKHLGSTYLPNVLLRYLIGLYIKARRFSNSQSFLSCIPSEIGLSGSKFMTSGNTSIGKKEVDFIGSAPKSAGCAASRRYRLNPQNIQKKSRQGSGRGINPSIAELQSSCNIVGADLLSSMDDCTAFSLRVSNRKHQRCMSDGLGEHMKELKSTLVELRQNVDSLSCSANLLVIEPDKCYREEGAEVSLELSTSNEWLIAIRRLGSLRYCIKAQNVMRPSTSNRFTHAMIWAVVNSWKLEFTDRREWFIFKELHKECYDRNMQTPSVRILPVPGVHEVPGNGDSKCIPFVRPERYITMKEDEVARALMRTTANYDIQSDDEEFLSNFNNEFHCGDNVGSERISVDNFEKVIDTFEKTEYCRPDDIADENKAVNLCLNLGRREVLVAIYNHWVKKRKQKRSTLIRVFQCHPPRRAQLIQKPFLRKKRSFKRKGNQYGRGKQPRFLQAMAEEHDVMEARHRVEEAESSARRSLEVATFKRRRAQILMENADLATYKATIALRLAEAIQRSELRESDTATATATTSFIG